MSYENAPSTKMLATHCAVCARPLRDAKSVEAAMGPDCRKKHGFNVECSEETRSHANKIIYRVALARSNASFLNEVANGLTLGGFIARETEELRDIGFERLADIIVKRTIVIRIEAREDGRLNVFTPYKDGIGEAFQGVPGRRWDADAKVNHVPNNGPARKALFALLGSWFPGETATGPKGPFTVPA